MNDQYQFSSVLGNKRQFEEKGVTKKRLEFLRERAFRKLGNIRNCKEGTFNVKGGGEKGLISCLTGLAFSLRSGNTQVQFPVCVRLSFFVVFFNTLCKFLIITQNMP
jgi:hypothetical protein